MYLYKINGKVRAFRHLGTEGIIQMLCEEFMLSRTNVVFYTDVFVEEDKYNGYFS